MIASEILKSWKQKDSVDRETVQNTLYEFFKFHGNVFMMLATGVGKSKSALQCVENRKTLIICERIPHIENWKKEIEKFQIKGDITIICFQSAKKYTDVDWDLVIIDEVDACIGPNAMSNYKKMKTKNWIFLSADAEKEHLDLMREICDFKTFKIALKDAIRWKLLPAPQIIYKPVLLDNKKRYIKVPKTKFLFKSVSDNLKTEKEYDDILNREIDYWKAEVVSKGSHKGGKPTFAGFNLFAVGNYRKLFYSQLKASKVMKKKSKDRTIYFTGSIDICKNFKNDIHSKKSKQECQEILDEFNNGNINYISCVDKLNRGMNLKNCKKGVVLSITYKNFIELRQRIGRILRDDEPVIEIYYVEGKESKLIDKFKKDFETV